MAGRAENGGYILGTPKINRRHPSKKSRVHQIIGRKQEKPFLYII